MKPAIALARLVHFRMRRVPGRAEYRHRQGRTRTRAEVDAGEWGLRAPLLEPNSELALAESNGKLYLLGGYPASRETVRTVQIYDIASDRWELGPPLPLPNNHGMAASVNGKIYLIGGQTTADDPSYVNTVYELDPASGCMGRRRRRCPRRAAPGWPSCTTARSTSPVDARRAETTSPSTTRRPIAGRCCRTCPPSATTSPARRSTAASTSSEGVKATDCRPSMTTAHEVFDPQTRTWTTAAPMLRARSGMNGVMARGCFHVWGGEGPAGMFPDHDYYDPRTNTWTRLPDMPIPVHGVYGSAFVDGLIWVTGGGTDIGGNHGSLSQPGLPADGELRVHLRHWLLNIAHALRQQRGFSWLPAGE